MTTVSSTAGPASNSPADTRPPSPLPPLGPVSSISRRVTLPEYYHACIGTSRRTLEGPRHQGFFIHGVGSVPPEQWQHALDQVAATNPGARLRLKGRLWWSRWESDGAPPRLRIVNHCDWDMRSSHGAAFIDATPLPLRHGPTIELVVANMTDGSTLLLLRSHHAVMDGIGAMQFLEDLFRVLRGESLPGVNVAYSDVDLMLSVGATHSTSRHIKTQWLTGAPAGDEMDDEWRRISLGPPSRNLMPRLAAALAEFTHRTTDLPALFAVPVNLRRHVPGLRATTNFSNMLMVKLDPGDGAEQFSERLKGMLTERMEAFYPKVLDLFRLLPMSWLDRMLSRTVKNYRTKKAMETAVISNLGRFDAEVMTCPGFTPERMFVSPLSGSAFTTLICLSNHVELAINLPNVLGNNGRFDALVDHLRQRLATPEPSTPAES